MDSIENWGWEQPWLLTLLVTAVLPLLTTLMRGRSHPWLELIPVNSFSHVVDALIRFMGAVALAGITLGLAGPYRSEYQIERLGRGAQIALVLDRSSSMDSTFAGSPPSGGEESKAAAARRLLTDFVHSRHDDLYAVTVFSTTAMRVLSWTSQAEAVEAAVRPLTQPGLAFTHVAKGLAMAASFFQRRTETASRVILLVSDGAAVIDFEDQQRIRRWLQHFHISLYWVFLRTANSPGLSYEPNNDSSGSAQPEAMLHDYFKTLGVPYRAYEAENPEELARAISDIGQLESHPARYYEPVPRWRLAPLCYGTAFFAVMVLTLAKWLELR